MTVVPRSLFILCMVCRKSDAAMGSNCDVGSSRISTSGCMAMIDARLSICFCPPESSATFLRNQLSMPKYAAISATLLFITSLGMPRFSRPNASSCQTLSVTIWLSGFCWTKPMAEASFLSEISSKRPPEKWISPFLSP